MNAHSLLQLTLFVRDIDESAGFYRALGLNLYGVDDPGFPRYYEGGLGSTMILLHPAADRVVTSVKIGFRVLSISEVATTLDELGTAYELPLPLPKYWRRTVFDSRRARSAGLHVGAVRPCAR
ncbi:MAG: hypothetical protein ACPGVG_15375 [Mycobacterium sp.]